MCLKNIFFVLIFFHLSKSQEYGELACFSDTLEQLENIKMKFSGTQQEKQYWYEKAFVDGQQKIIGTALINCLQALSTESLACQRLSLRYYEDTLYAVSKHLFCYL